MKNYEEAINAMWEEVEGKKLERPEKKTEQEEWEELKKEYYGTHCCVQTRWGIIDFNPDCLKVIRGGEKLSYDEYLEIMRISGNKVRHFFELCYYDASECDFKGQIEKKSKGRVYFQRIFVTGWYGDGTGFEGKEDHVWMSAAGFEKYKTGDNVSFSATVYRYLKIGNGKALDYALEDPVCVAKTDAYSLPTKDDLLMQSIDQIICEVCIFNEHCYMGMCIANEEWRESMRQLLFAGMKYEK